jgi:hypothetical protein
VLYPLPKDVIPIDSKEARGSILQIWGNFVVGLMVKSDGKSYPISNNLEFLILPIDLLDDSTIAP